MKFKAYDKKTKKWLSDFRIHPDGRVMKVMPQSPGDSLLWKYENSTEVLNNIELYMVTKVLGKEELVRI